MARSGGEGVGEFQREYVTLPGTLTLTEEQKQVSVDRILKAVNPNARSVPVTFSHKREERVFKFVPTVDHLAVHLSDDGHCIQKDSEEARRQAEEKQRRWRELQQAEDAERNPSAATTDISIKVLKNQFNFCDRASQSFNNPTRERGAMTEPPPIITFSATATQWEIYDAYQEDLKQQQSAMARAAKAPSRSGRDDKGRGPDPADDGPEDVLASGPLLHSLKLMERMVNQNTYHDVSDDYKYWEDAADQFKEDGGTLLPLWKFTSDWARKKAATALVWNPRYSDLFAVGYGSYDLQKAAPGLIHCFSLKNPSFPEYTFSCPSGVMSLDFHPDHPSLLAVGLHDGSVSVFDIRLSQERPIYQSNLRTGKHVDPVWQVRWLKEEPGKPLAFCSVGGDGRVVRWQLAKAELQGADVMGLTATSDPAAAPAAKADAGPSLLGALGCTCFDFNPFHEGVYIVGTEEGIIHQCSRAYSAQPLHSYQGHDMPIYSVQWNPFHPDVFLTASADWTVKLWQQGNPTPLLSFDTGGAVGDACWAPYSSTVLAAATADGKVHVFDLSENRHEPMCEQLVVRKARLTRLRFNPKTPVLLVGDDRGLVLSLKLSPNLRKVPKSEEGKTREETEADRLGRIIQSTVRDKELLTAAPPPALSRPNLPIP